MKKVVLLLFCSLFLLSGTTHKPKYSHKHWGAVAYYFENENELRNFFDFHKGDVVAEVGTYTGYNMKGFSLVADSCTFWLQDIDTTALSLKNYNKIVKHCNKLNASNKFYRCIGTETQTNLPDNSCDKIFIITTICMFSHFDEMIDDINKKLKPNGQLYILQPKMCLTKGHKNYTLNEISERVENHKFSLVKQEEKDFTKKPARNVVLCAVFQKTDKGL